MASALAVAALLGCGRSGTWSDDPGNFERAWGDAPPAGVVVQRSWYWRSAHWTREEAYFFEFAPDDAFLRGFVEANGLAPAPETTSSAIAARSFAFERPAWFASAAGVYEAWSPASGDDVLVVREKATGEFFVYACQM